MPDAIATAEKTLATAMYTSGDKETFAAVIKNAKDLYAAQMAGQYTADGSQALIDAKAALAKGIDDFIASVKMDNIVAIDFSNAYTETPAAEEGEDPTYSIAGAKGKIDILGAFSKDMQTEWTQYAFGQGFNDLYTDALYFGKGDASVAFDYAAKSNDVIAVSFDIYFGYLSKQSMGFYLLNENGDTISVEKLSRWASHICVPINISTDYARLGSMNVVGNVADIFSPVKHLYWFAATTEDGVEYEYDFLSPSEIKSLKAANVFLPEKELMARLDKAYRLEGLP